MDDIDLTLIFKWFVEIHSDLERRAVVSPPLLNDLPNFSSQHSGTSTLAVDSGQLSSADQAVALTPTNTGENVKLVIPATSDGEDLIRPKTLPTDGGDQPDLHTFPTVSVEQAGLGQQHWPQTPQTANKANITLSLHTYPLSIV